MRISFRLACPSFLAIVLLLTPSVTARPIDVGLERRQGVGVEEGMIKTVSKVNNQAGQTIAETCYFAPSNPSKQQCSTTVILTTEEEATNDGRTSTYYPSGIATATIEPNDQPISVVLGSLILPTQTTTLESASSDAIMGHQAVATEIIFSKTSETIPVQSAMGLITAAVSVSGPSSTSTSSQDAAAQEASSITASEIIIPGQHLEVLPIGLGIYSSLIGLLLCVTIYMFLIRMKYRREYRARKTGVGMGIAAVMGLSAGGVGVTHTDGRFESAEVRHAR